MQDSAYNYENTNYNLLISKDLLVYNVFIRTILL